MINSFVNNIYRNSSKVIIKYLKGSKVIPKTNSEFYQDILKMRTLFEKHQLKPKDKILVFVKPSYEFYVTMFAGIMHGINLVVIDSFKDKNKTLKMLQKTNTSIAFVDNVTSKLKIFLPKLYKYVNITNYKKNNAFKKEEQFDNNQIVLTTFTSGTTGTPKAINRTLNDFIKQIRMIDANIKFNDQESVISTLPIYTMFTIFKGITTIISTKISPKIVRKTCAQNIISSIVKLKSIKKPLVGIKSVYLGGAILYSRDALMLKKLYPSAQINYNYGSSEGLLIFKTTIDKYLANQCFVFDEFVKGMKVEIINSNDDGVGEIVISGDVVLNEGHSHNTKDLGFIQDNKLYLVGRSKISNIEHKFYNYLVDEKHYQKNQKLKTGFSLYFKNKIYFVYIGKISNKLENVTYVKLSKLPMDLKHETKLDYYKVIDILQKKAK